MAVVEARPWFPAPLGQLDAGGEIQDQGAGLQLVDPSLRLQTEAIQVEDEADIFPFFGHHPPLGGQRDPLFGDSHQGGRDLSPLRVHS